MNLPIYLQTIFFLTQICWANQEKWEFWKSNDFTSRVKAFFQGNLANSPWRMFFGEPTSRPVGFTMQISFWVENCMWIWRFTNQPINFPSFPYLHKFPQPTNRNWIGHIRLKFFPSKILDWVQSFTLKRRKWENFYNILAHILTWISALTTIWEFVVNVKDFHADSPNASCKNLFGMQVCYQLYIRNCYAFDIFFFLNATVPYKL